MRAIDLLLFKKLGTWSGKAYYSRPNLRAFLLYVLAGDSTVVINADLRGGRLNLAGANGAYVMGCKVGEAQQCQT